MRTTSIHDQEVVVEDGLVTSRKPGDLPAFMITGGFSEQELRDAGAVAVFESVEELGRRLDETPLAPPAPAAT